MTANGTVLGSDDVEHFLDKGYVKLRACFSPEAANEYSKYIWDRLGYDPGDRSTWARPSIHMASHEDIDVKTFAPKAWRAACELIGGEDRMAADKPDARAFPWTDGFIVNLYNGADQPWRPASPESPGWHVDGNWFRHYLDSPEQGLLTIVLWSDVVHRGGATFIAGDSVGPVARFLAEHPEGIRPAKDGSGFPYPELIGQCTDYAEATGEVGDVYLIHPLVLHTMSPNVLRRARFITNSTLRLAEPMRFNRPDPADHSPVERAILRALGVERFDFTATGPRERVVSELSVEHERTKREEHDRMVAAGWTARS